MRQKIVTIVGGSGFLGRYVVKEFARAGWVVRVICRHPGQAEYLKPLGNPGQIVAVYGDLTRPHSLEGKFEDSHTVVNLAGILFERGKSKFQGIHAHAAEWIAKHAKEAGVERLIHVSALGLDKTAEVSNYAKTKRLGEQWVRMVMPEVTILRPGLFFGPEDNFFNKFARMAVLSPALPVIGGQKRWQPVYVADVARAIRRAAEREDTAGRTYELGGPRVYAFRELFEFILRCVRRDRKLVAMPFWAARIMGAFAQLLPAPPLTVDQVNFLAYDNVASGEYPGFAELGIAPTPMEMVVPQYLSIYAGKSVELSRTHA